MLLFVSFILVVIASEALLIATKLKIPSLSWSFTKPSTFFLSWLKKQRFFSSLIRSLVFNTSTMEKKRVESSDKVSLLLDLPDVVLECVLERVSAAELYSTGGVCKYLREKCTSDYFWEKHMKRKWGALIDDATYHKWKQSHIAIPASNTGKQKGGFFFITLLHRNRSKAVNNHNSIPVLGSIMSFYLSLESGKFWFPAQVYNREVQNGHVGFMLSCYDAQVCYDFRTDTFKARYSARGGQTIEENIAWNRLRKPAVDTPADLLHESDYISDLKPNDHIEIQWRKSKEFPNGWWYGVVGHLESCISEESNCQCHTSDKVVLEFKQYALGSKWRRVVINRKEHREVGNKEDGFYGGIRKLHGVEEISVWKHLWKTSCASASSSTSASNNNSTAQT